MLRYCVIFLTLLFLSFRSCHVYASVVPSSGCFVKAEVTNTNSGEEVGYIDLQLKEINGENCLFRQGETYRAVDNYPGVLKKGDQLSSLLIISSSMGPEGPVNFLQWSRLTYEDGSPITNLNNSVITNLQSTNIPLFKCKLNKREVQEIGRRVFKNECNSKDENLAFWNKGEEFVSLGIGHFIWYPSGSIKPFQESFIKFLKYAKASGQRLPRWLDIDPFPPCPWASREIFLEAQSDIQMKILRDFLKKTKYLQAEFIVKRLEDSFPLILEKAPQRSREKVAAQFKRVASAPRGVYILADYVNFKGLGIIDSERYKGEGWGLLQVLEGMRDEIEAPDPIKEFVYSAENLLERRVSNSPLGRNEQKWLPGWKRRVNSYLLGS